MTISVLYVDDDTDYHQIVSRFFEREEDLSVRLCSMAEDGLKALELEPFDVVVSDYQMPVMDGISLLKEVRNRYGRLPFILFTGRGREEVAIQAINNGVDYYLQKGGDPAAQFTDLFHKIRSLHQKNINESLARENERRFNTTLDRIHMVAFHLDEEGIVQYCNDFLLSLTGWKREEFLHQNFFELAVPPDLREMKKRLYKEAIKNETISQHEEMKILLRSGEIRDLDIINTDLRDEKGRFFGYMCIGEDVTEKKKAREKIAEMSRKFRLLQSITRHDVINIVTSIRGYMDILDEFEDPGEKERVQNTILDLLDRIENLIQFLREYEQVGAQPPVWQNIASLARNIYTSGVPVRCLVPDNLSVYADPMLGHVFSNLYHNSLIHGGKVTEISCHMEQDDKGINIIWEDNGKGVPNEEKDRIFLLSHGRNSGFGLYFISEVLAMTGITITENGEPGKGARFEINVPHGTFKQEKE
ncbi:MAG TPA: response regulator [Methanospirillum sp.]|uniref:response regulator n=1 Tax=Methanospirillum sp. TaxID=45200 RepID=UPI002C920F89|nr:response regulator [Methanospirillum sp.]HPY60259.1 response regulator [Methanospirillum sp.]